MHACWDACLHALRAACVTAQTDDGDGAEPSAADGPAPMRQLVDSAWLGLVEGCKETGTYALVGPKPWSVTQRHYSFS